MTTKKLRAYHDPSLTRSAKVLTRSRFTALSEFEAVTDREQSNIIRGFGLGEPYNELTREGYGNE